jgi:thiamine biosynthesis lipoprotein
MPIISSTFHRVRPLLGTFVAIEAEGGTQAEPAVAAAFAAVLRVERLMRPLTAGSDVARISSAAPGETLPIDAWTYAVLERARAFHGASRGLFDPCRPTQPGRLGDLELLPPDRVVCRAPVALDLGGIAKGFAVDRAIDELKRHRCTRGIVNAGGDLRWFGTGTHTVVLRRETPHATESLRIELAEGALAVSAPRSSASPREHVGYYLGTSGEPATGRWTAVIAAEATLADALVKCVMLGTPRDAAELLARYGARMVQPPVAPG